MSELKPDKPAAEDFVADYLSRDLHFFDRHRELLESLDLPHGENNTLSLVRKQVAVLRDKNVALEKKFEAIVGIARYNEKLSISLHQLSLALMRANTVNKAVAVSLALLKEQLPGNQAAIRLFGKYAAQDARVPPLLQPLFETGKPDCGPFSDAVKSALLGNFAPRATSVVVMPLARKKSRIGLLTLASFDSEAFMPGKGTMFLVQFGELISAAIASCATSENR